MNAARWEQIQALFHEVADLPDPAQRASLEAQCAEDPTLMTEVLSLLEQDARGDSLLDRDAAHVAAEVLDEGIRSEERRVGIGWRCRLWQNNQVEYEFPVQ